VTAALRTGPRTWTSAFGRACGVLLDAIVRRLALARVNPNSLDAFRLGERLAAMGLPSKLEHTEVAA